MECQVGYCPDLEKDEHERVLVGLRPTEVLYSGVICHWEHYNMRSDELESFLRTAQSALRP